MNNLKGFARYLLTLIMIFCVITFIGCNGCSTQEKYFNEHCYEYGFIPTDIKYHFRYVGKAKALLIQETAINDIGEKGE